MTASDFSGKRLLLVGTGGVKRKAVLERVRALGLARITCLHDAVNWAAPYVDDWIEADSVRWSPSTATRVREAIGRPDAVWTYDDYSVVVAAELAAAFELPGMDPRAAMRAKDKQAFRAVCSAAGIRTPRFVRLKPRAPDADALVAAALSYPVVVKPVHGAGSVLVRKVAGEMELAWTLAEYADALESEPVAALWPNRDVLVEEYVPGSEVDVDMLLQDGALRYAKVSDNFAPVEPFFLEVGGQIPSSLPDPAIGELVDVARRTLNALGVRDGCIHFEARWTEHGAVPIEANLRLGGAEVFAFHRGAYGVDLVEQAVRIALGAAVPDLRPATARRHLVSAAFIPPCSGLLRRIETAPRIEAEAGFEELVLFRSAGEEVLVPPDGFDYVGWVVAGGATREEARRRLAAIREKTVVEVSPRARC